ncbi:MAG: HAMP domain-containing sensor histidine kinase [Balneolales bacterium]
MHQYLTYRWFLLGLGILAIVGLTGMNVYSLYSLHVSTVSNSIEHQKSQLAEVSDQVRTRFRTPVQDIYKLNMDQIQYAVENSFALPDAFLEMVSIASLDPIFSDIYYSDADCKACEGKGQLQKYNSLSNQFEWVDNPPGIVRDGIGIARTRMLAMINDYRWKTRVIFDTHRSMTIALINPRDQSIVGYLNFVINKNFLVNQYLGPLLAQSFSHNNNGIIVWLHDWTQNDVLFATNTEQEYEWGDVDIIQQFPDLLHDWNLKATVNYNPVMAASRTSFYRNISVLAATVLFLMGAMVFMFITAQRERHLAVQQAGFLANVTHELKTPLAVMQAAGENLADGRVKDNDRLTSYGQHIHNEAIRLRQMIDKMLDVAKADAGKLVLKATPASLNKIVQDHLKLHAAYIENKGFTLLFQPDEDDPYIYVDVESVKTIITNLVENAVKYSFMEKYIGIKISHSQEKVHLDIEDRGLGIPRKDQKRIFDKFFRVEDALTAKTKGHGLGLSIVRTLTHLNGAQITIKSTYRKGSVFSIHFPQYIHHAKPTNNDKSRATTEYINT